MQARIEQRSNVKLGVLLGKIQAQILRELRQAYGQENTMSKGQIHLWFHRFNADPTSPVTDKPWPGKPCMRHTKQDKVLDLLEEDRRITLHQVAAGAQISTTTAHRILRKDLQYSKIAPKMVPHMLTEEQKNCRRSIAEQNLAKIRSDPAFFTKLVTTDESWVFQWVSPVEPRPLKALRAWSTTKTMLVLFFDNEGVVHMEFKDEGTITTEVYLNILR